MSSPPPASFASAFAPRRRMPLRLAPPVATIEMVAEPTALDWVGDLRFFATCYAAGLLFFLVMLS